MLIKIKIPEILKNIIYSSIANGLALVISMISTLIIPKLVGVEAYSYYQLYIFYIGYVAILNFGLNEGIYLRYGGFKHSEIEDIDKQAIASQYWLNMIFQIAVYALLFIIVIHTNIEFDKRIVLTFVCITAIIINPRYISLYVLLALGESKKYSTITILEKIITITLILFLNVFFNVNILFILISDVIGKLVSSVVCVVVCKEYIFKKFVNFKLLTYEFKENIKVGSKLLISSLASILILGVMRLGIEQHWNVIAFGKVSLAISISNMMLQFVNAVSIVIYPIIKRVKQETRSLLFENMRTLINFMILLLMSFYFPFSKILLAWLPQYSESIKYLSILLPICFFECRMSMIVTVFFQAIRKETSLLKCNLFSLMISVALILISIKIGNLDFAVLSILIALGVKCIVAESTLSKYLKVKIKNTILVEVLLVLLFVFLHWYLDFIGFIIYFIMILIVIFKKMNIIRDSVIYIKKLLN